MAQAAGYGGLLLAFAASFYFVRRYTIEKRRRPTMQAEDSGGVSNVSTEGTYAFFILPLICDGRSALDLTKGMLLLF